MVIWILKGDDKPMEVPDQKMLKWDLDNFNILRICSFSKKSEGKLSPSDVDASGEVHVKIPVTVLF